MMLASACGPAAAMRFNLDLSALLHSTQESESFSLPARTHKSFAAPDTIGFRALSDAQFSSYFFLLLYISLQPREMKWLPHSSPLFYIQ